MAGDLRASLWCAHPRLKPGEAFSSWLHRCAFANGMSNHTYCRHVFGERAVWNRDVDHLANDAILREAASATLEDVDHLKAGTLLAFSGVLFETAERGGHFPWILSLGVYHRLRRRHGQQFCVACLRDGEAWLRLYWRLAWMTCCPKHQCFLQDACPRCDAPFVFHRMSLAVPGRLACHACGANVLKQSSMQPAPQKAQRFQQRMLRGLATGMIAIGRDRYTPAMEYFAGLRVLARGVFSKKRLVGLQDTLPRTAWRQAPPRPRMNIEHWRLKERAFAMDVLRRTLADWPGGFVADCRRAGIYQIRFEPRCGSLKEPDWLLKGLEAIRRR